MQKKRFNPRFELFFGVDLRDGLHQQKRQEKRGDTMERRDFVQNVCGALLAGSLANGTRVSARSANDTVRVAVIGFRGQGGTHIRNYLRMQNVEVAALCDVDPTVLAKGVADVEKASGKKPATFSDVRKLLEDKSIDAVSIATPNHGTR
jgi:hypothetical protein